MNTQLELKLNRRRHAAGTRRPLWRHALYWAPVWLPLVLLVQVLLVGLRPAWAEKLRLDEAEQEVVTREDRLQASYEALVEDDRKLSDPIYRERVRRSLRDLGRKPLTLESTRHPGS